MMTFHVSIVGANDGGARLPVTFEHVFESLLDFDRLFIEPDGSFVWTGMAAEGVAWQVDGNLIDRGDVLAYVELKGCCPERQLDRLLAAFGWPQSVLAFQLPQRGVVLSEAEFRKLAISQAGAV